MAEAKERLSAREEQLLNKFQSEKNRRREEAFIRLFSERNTLRLFFINDDAAHTDGQNIILDPAYGFIFCDKECLKKSQEFLGWEDTLSKAPWNALKMVTRGLALHE